MSDLEQRANELFAAARKLEPVDRKMLDRVAVRLENKPRHLPLLPLAAALAVALVILARAPAEETALADAPVLAPAPKFESKRLMRATQTAAPKPRARFRTVLVEQPPPQETKMVPLAPIVEELVPAPKRYLPRAIADFQREQEDDALRAYIQWIIVKPDATVCR